MKTRRVWKLALGLLSPFALLMPVLVNLNSWRPRVLQVSRGVAFQVTWSPDGSQVAVASHGVRSSYAAHRSGRVDLWRVSPPRPWKLPGVFEHRAMPVNSPASLCFSGDGATLICTGYNERISRFDARTGHLAQTLRKDGSTGTYAQAWPQRDSFTFWNDHNIEQRSTKTGRVQKKLKNFLPYEDASGEQEVFALAPNGKTIAWSESDGTDNVRLRDVATNRARLLSLGPGKDYITYGVDALAWSPDSRILLVAKRVDGTQPSDGTTWAVMHSVFWNPQTRKIVRSWREQSRVTAYAFSPDGARVAVSHRNGPVHLRDVRSGELLRTLQTKIGITTSSVAFSPDGRTLAVAGGDGTLALWRMW